MKTRHQLSTLPAGPFTARLWNENEDLIEQIFNHPFCRGLSNGSLPDASFKHYLQQDALYIEQDARAFAITAGKAYSRESFTFFLDMARDGLEIERVLHRNLMPEFGVVPVEKMSAACYSYTSFLLDNALNNSFRVSAAALLPCFWIYRETGLIIRQSSVECNRYQPWLETYSDDIYAGYVEKFVRTVEKEMSAATKQEKDRMAHVFQKSLHFEISFFSEAWQWQFQK